MSDRFSDVASPLLLTSENVGDLAPPAGQRGNRATDPLVGGAATTVISDDATAIAGYGTLGGVVFDGSGGGPLALSAAHVWGQEAGKLAIEPFGGAPPMLGTDTSLLRGSGADAAPLSLLAPAPFASLLSRAAINSWMAILTGVSEDPSRSGQAATVVSAAARTGAEDIRVTADAPPFPFAGRLISTPTTWAYRRHANTGVLDFNVTQNRSAAASLVGKRVWTSAKTLSRGQRVNIGAELFPALEAGTAPSKIAIPAAAVAASANDGNVPANTVDGNLATRWSASGDGQWIRFDLGFNRRVTHVKIAFFNGPDRTYTFDIQVSNDSSTWTTAKTGVQSLRTAGLETFDIPDFDPIRFVRIVGHQNTVNAFNSYTEVEIFGTDPVASPRFVVANLFPLSAPTSLVRRVMDPGPAPEPSDTRVSFRGFPRPPRPVPPRSFQCLPIPSVPTPSRQVPGSAGPCRPVSRRERLRCSCQLGPRGCLFLRRRRLRSRYFTAAPASPRWPFPPPASN